MVLWMYLRQTFALDEQRRQLREQVVRAFHRRLVLRRIAVDDRAQMAVTRDGTLE